MYPIAFTAFCFYFGLAFSPKRTWMKCIRWNCCCYILLKLEMNSAGIWLSYLRNHLLVVSIGRRRIRRGEEEEIWTKDIIMEISKTIYYYFRLKVFQVEAKLRRRNPKPNRPIGRPDRNGMQFMQICVYVLIFITSFFASSYQISARSGRNRYADQ